MSRDRLAEAEWKADCLQSRMDALAKSRADASKDQSIAALKAEMDRYSKLYDKTPNRDATNKNMYYKKFSEASTAYHKAVAARGDADDPCWEGYEQRGTKEKGGSTVPNCVKA